MVSKSFALITSNKIDTCFSNAFSILLNLFESNRTPLFVLVNIAFDVFLSIDGFGISGGFLTFRRSLTISSYKVSPIDGFSVMPLNPALPSVVISAFFEE